MAAPGIAPREWAVALFGGWTLAWSAWAFAGMQLWALHSLLAGAGLTFLAAVLPLPAKWNGTDGTHGNWRNVKRLLGFPVFWFGLFFLVYVVIQGLNPAWVRMEDPETKAWWVESVEPVVAWLPTGAQAAYAEMNAFRVAVIFLAGYLLIWGLWVGIRRRQSALAVLWLFVVSGVSMGLVGILQKFTGAEKVLWVSASSNAQFWGSFYYRNQGVAYLVLVMVAAAVLYFYHYNRSQRRGQSGGPYLLLFLFVGMTYASIAMALSRGGILFGGIFFSLFVVGALGRWLFSSSLRQSLLVSGLAGVMLLGASFGLVRLVDFEAIEKRFGDISETIENADRDARMISTQVTWSIAKEQPVYGWGAGSFRYIFPMYQRYYPTIFYQGYHQKKGWWGRKIYHQAHNDIVEFFYQFGIVGCSFLVLTLLYWIFHLCFRAGGNAMGALMLLLGLGVACGHAFVDFIFQSPAYWVAFSGLCCIAVKLLALHSKRVYG